MGRDQLECGEEDEEEQVIKIEDPRLARVSDIIGPGIYRNRVYGSGYLDRNPPFTTNIEAAWLCVEWATKKGLRFVIMPDWNQNWQVVVYDKSEFRYQTDFKKNVCEVVVDATIASSSIEADGE